VFELARRYDTDIDLHIDFGNAPEDMDLDLVCRLTDRDRMGGRVAVAHVTKLTTHRLEDQRRTARRLAEAGITLSVLPATDVFLMGRDQTDNIRRGVVNANMLLAEGANATLGSNNILNAFTPFGDCSLVRIANMYAHIAQVSNDADMAACFGMLTTNAARMLNHGDYGVAVGNPGDLVLFDAASAVEILRELRQPLLAIKRGRRTMNWDRPVLLGP
jgi:cytosine deaminase